MNYDTLYEIMLRADFDSLEELKMTGRTAYHIFNSESFWKDKFIYDFGEKYLHLRDRWEKWRYMWYDFTLSFNTTYSISGVTLSPNGHDEHPLDLKSPQTLEIVEAYITDAIDSAIKELEYPVILYTIHIDTTTNLVEVRFISRDDNLEYYNMEYTILTYIHHVYEPETEYVLGTIDGEDFRPYLTMP